MKTRWSLPVLAAALLAGGWVLHEFSGRKGSDRPASGPERAAESGEAAPIELAEPSSALAEGPGQKSARVELESAARKTPAQEPASAEPGPEEALLRIRVVSRETREPVPWIRLTLRPGGGEPAGAEIPGGTTERSTKGDQDGRAEFVLPARQDHALLVNIPPCVSAGHAEMDVAALDAGERRALVVEVPTVFDLLWRGQAVDGETGAPLPDATTTVFSEASSGPIDPEPVRARPDGTFEVRASSWSRHTVRVEAPGFFWAAVRIDPEGDDSEPFRVPLLRSATLVVLVTDGTGAPRPSIEVIASAPLVLDSGPWPRGFRDELEWTCTTGTDGTCTLAGLPSRTALILEFGEPDGVLRRAGEKLLLQPGERRELTLVFGSGCAIRGLALDPEGRPVSGLSIWLSSSSVFERYFAVPDESSRTESDARGRFVFESVPAGRWWVAVSPLEVGNDIAPGPVEVMVTGDEREHPVTLTVWRGLFIHGKVLGSDGRPAQGCSITGQFADDGLVHASSGEDGTFRLGPLVPGEYSLVAGSKGSLECRSEPALARAGDEDVVLRLRPGGGILGRLQDARGLRPLKVNLLLFESVGAGLRAAFLDLDENGIIQCAGLEPGLYHAVARTADGQVAWARGIRVEAGVVTSGIELRLEPGATLRIRAAAEIPGPSSYRVRIDGLTVATGMIQPGDTAEIVVPAGTITVELPGGSPGARPDRPRAEEITLSPGEEGLVEFDLRD